MIKYEQLKQGMIVQYKLKQSIN